jgi:molecular chaperone DnaK
VTGYSLGVDLGTTFSAAATVDDTGIPAIVGLGNRAMQIPSVLYVGADGEVLVGDPDRPRIQAADG